MRSYSNNIYTAPTAEQHNIIMEEHGNKRVDKYFWLNNASDKNVINYLLAENEFTGLFMKNNGHFEIKIFNEIIGRIKEVDQTVPYYFNGYYYYSRFEQGNEYPIMYRKKGNLRIDAEVVLDINAMSAGHKLYKVDAFAISPDNSMLAFAVDISGDNKYNVIFKDLGTGRLLEESLRNADASIAWANDSKSFFYSIPNKAMRSYKVMMHVLGTPQNKDIEIYHEKDNKFDVWINKSKSKKYIFIVSESKVTSEVMYIDADNPGSSPVKIQERIDGVTYGVDHKDDSFYLLTNYNAKNFRLMITSEKNPGIEYWKEVIPYNQEVLIESYELFREHIVLMERSGGLDRIRIIGLKDKSEYYLEFEEEDYSVSPVDNVELNSEVFRYQYTSLKTPMSTIQFNLRTKETEVLKETEVPGNYRPEDYETKRVFAKSHDGVEIPVSLVYKKGLQKDGNNPLLLMGYGAYGIPFNVSFAPDRLSLLERGFIFAIAHIRGGQEMGRQWYEDGKFLKKKNTFLDFIAVAEYLITEKYTKPKRLFANGRSAGGMLMGVVANMRPDLFRGIIAEVPWMDVITDMMNTELPLTTEEYEEWGNPNDPEYYYYMLSYSPYDNLKAQKYPAMLVTGGLNDSQVPFWSPAKWVAKLRELKTDSNSVLLKTDMDSGHSGNSGRFEQFRATALKYAFILSQLEIKSE